jgi:hypothetical protein
MRNNPTRKPGHIRQLNWIRTDDKCRPLCPSWSLVVVDGIPVAGPRSLCTFCNATVMEKCDTSLVRAGREANQVRSLTMCGK